MQTPSHQSPPSSPPPPPSTSSSSSYFSIFRSHRKAKPNPSQKQTMANQNVTIKNTMLVFPAPKEQNQHSCNILKLSNLDRKCPALMYLVFFYKKAPHISGGGSLLRDLKKGLEETLAVWYPAAGRLCLDNESGRFNLDCNNFGALLVEAETKVQITELGDVSQENNFLEKLVFRPSVSPDRLTEMPLVVVQVTEFGCGGHAIGVGTSHALFDGVANFNFISAWASKTAGRENLKMQLDEPLHDRKRLLMKTHKLNKSNVMAFDHLLQLIKQAQEFQGKLERYGTCEEGSDQSEEDFVLGTFTISNEKIEKLKSKVTSCLGGISCTSFEVVAAHLWKARIKAIQIPEDKTICLQFSINARSKLSPPLPASFSGNAYVLSSVSTTSNHLLQQSLPSVVLKIKAAKNAVTSSYISSYLSALEARARAQHEMTAIPPLPELTVVSDWRQTPFQEVDFGGGPAVAAVPMAAPLPEAAYLMRGEGGVDVRIGLLRKHLVEFRGCFLDEL